MVFRSISKALFAFGDRFFDSLPGPRILIYHRVGAGNGKQMEVDYEDFAWQVEWLSINRKVVDLESAISQWHTLKSNDLVVLTFDDGYRDTYTTAFPLLKAYEMPFTIYVATSYIANDDNERGALTWNQLTEMAESGLATVAAHTHSHVDLRKLGPSEIEAEIEKSNSLLELRLGIRPQHFAYPWGYWSEMAELLTQDHYSSAALGAPHVKSLSCEFDPHRMHRFPVQRSDGRRWFQPRLNGGLLLEEELRRRIRGYQGP